MMEGPVDIFLGCWPLVGLRLCSYARCVISTSGSSCICMFEQGSFFIIN